MLQNLTRSFQVVDNFIIIIIIIIIMKKYKNSSQGQRIKVKYRQNSFEFNHC